MIKKLQRTAVICLLLITCTVASAQNDIILKTDGNEMIGKVIEIGTDDLKFTYQNETVQYTVLKKDIVKITFSSGRVEFFNNFDNGNSNANLGDHHNKVAILPFSYVKDQGDGGAAMSKKIQQETYSIFNSKKVNLQFQDPNTTNALLIKAGITGENEAGYTMGEICNILGVEYVIQGMVSIEKTGQSSYSSSSTSVKGKTGQKSSSHDLIGEILTSGKASTSTYGSTSDDFSSSITLNIYNDKGVNIFNKDHSSFWTSEDAYKITLNFLAKRAPIYMK